MQLRPLVITALLTLVASSCSAIAGGAPEPTSSRADIEAARTAPDELHYRNDEEAKPDAKPDGGGGEAHEPESNYVFDQERLHTFDLELTEEALTYIDADPRAEEYVSATLSFEGEPFGDVGLRYKGSVGAFVDCLSGVDGETLLPTGEKVCTKLSMKVKINWDGSDERFYDLKRLQFHSQNRDETQLHERLGYWLFAEMGVPVPRSVHARVTINGDYVGLFALTEQIDGRFARHHFEDGTGNVIKERWPTDADGTAVDEEHLVGGLKTNEKDGAAPLLRAFGEALEAANTDDELRAAIITFLDVEETMSLIAVDRAIRNDDGPLHFYCSDECVNHNYYWYADPETNKLHLIPWDLDNAFENIVEDTNPVSPIADAWDEISHDCAVFEYGDAGFPQRSAACDPVFAGLALFQDEYRAAQRRLLEGPFADGVIESKIAEWSNQIQEATIEAHDLHDDALEPERWQTAMARLRTSIEFARNQLRDDLAPSS